MPDEQPKPEKHPEPTLRGGIFEYARGKWFPWYAVLILPILLIIWVLYRAARERVQWVAAFATLAVMEALVLPAEAFHIWRGHWVFNEARIFGPKIFGVPIEEPLLYYFFGSLNVIVTMHAIQLALEHWEKK